MVHSNQNLSLQDLQSELKDTKQNKRTLQIIFLISLLTFIMLIINSPELSEDDKIKFYRIPKQPSDLLLINEVIKKYNNENSIFIHIAFIYLYIFLQSFAIPGPIFLSILSGALFGPIKGFIIVCLCATFGASCCYGLSYTFGRAIVINSFGDKVLQFKKKTLENKDSIFYYILFLRITPIVPNWFINISAPIVGISFANFFMGTLIGLMPANVIHVRTGVFLNDAKQFGLDFYSMISLAGLALLALIPIIIKQKYKAKAV